MLIENNHVYQANDVIYWLPLIHFLYLTGDFLQRIFGYY